MLKYKKFSIINIMHFLIFKIENQHFTNFLVKKVEK